MVGAIAILIVLVVLPIVVVLSGAIGAFVLGQFLYKDGEIRNEGSELIDLNV
jgi:hypothetical protein